MGRVRSKLNDVLGQENVTKKQLKEVSGLCFNSVYRMCDNPEALSMASIIAILDALYFITGKEYKLEDVLVYSADEIPM